MLIDTRKEYSYKVIDPSYVAEEKNSPKHAYFFVAGLLLGMMVALLYLGFKTSIALSQNKKYGIN